MIYMSMSVEICVCTSQADKARGYGARVYCVGVMDFDQNQVGGLLSVSPLFLISFICWPVRKRHFSLVLTVWVVQTLSLYLSFCVSVCVGQSFSRPLCFWPEFINSPWPRLVGLKPPEDRTARSWQGFVVYSAFKLCQNTENILVWVPTSSEGLWFPPVQVSGDWEGVLC